MIKDPVSHPEVDTHHLSKTNLITESDLVGLPPPVQRYLMFSGVIGKPHIVTAHVQYKGRFRTAKDKSWMPISASQFYTINPPGFLWKAQFKIAGLPAMFATDTYKSGHSRMHGKLLGLFTVVDGQGETVDQGTMVRYLQEMTWFPTAYLGDNITWEAVDDHAADVTLHDSGKTVSGRMYFDDDGRLLTFSAERYGEFNGLYKIRTWTTPTTEFDTFCDLQLPSAGMGVWRLPEGDFSYIDVHLTNVEYNQPVEDF